MGSDESFTATVVKSHENKGLLDGYLQAGRDDRGFNSWACAIKRFMAAIDNAV